MLKVLDVRGVNVLFDVGYSLAFCNLSSHPRDPSGGRSGPFLAQIARGLGDPCCTGHLCLSPAPAPEWHAPLGMSLALLPF